jgi:hypothetical protein
VNSIGFSVTCGKIASLHDDSVAFAPGFLSYRHPGLPPATGSVVYHEFCKHFIKMPDIAHSALAFLQSSGILRPKSVAPLTNRFIRNFDSPLSQEIFDIPKTETESMVQPNSMTDDFRRESMSVVQ